MQKDIKKVLVKYKEKFPDDILVNKYLDFLGGNTNCIDRKNMNGHFTVSALVVKNNSVLMLWHKTFQRRQQPGGHIDPPDKTLLEAIIREVKEETGIDVVPDENFAGGIFSDIPIILEINKIAENKNKNEGEHLHYDIWFLLKLIDERREITNQDDGTENAEWVEVEKINSEYNSVAFKAIGKYKKYV